MKIEVVEYDQNWPALFAEEAEKIKGILGPELLEIHHIGSTSVQGLRAKPIIDILPVVRDIQIVDEHGLEFAALGYEALGEFGLKGRRYFRKGRKKRTHQVHIFSMDNAGEIIRHLALRDYLRSHPWKAREYARLKSELAALYPHDPSAYMDGKDQFVQELEKEALRWRGRL